MGGNRAYLAAKQIIPLFKPRVILDFGVAAGVNPALSPGAVFLAEKARDLSGFIRLWEAQDPFFTSTRQLPEILDSEEILTSSEILVQAMKKGDVKTGTAGSADFFLQCSLVREELCRRGIDIFDNETFSVVKAAAESGIPVLSVRGISDLGEENAQGEFYKNLKQSLACAAEFLPILCSILF
jgi:nucleoside phosphorylase